MNVEDLKERVTAAYADRTKAQEPFFAMAIRETLNLVDRGVLRADFAQALLTQRLPEHPGYFGEMVWILMMLEQWLRAKAPGYRCASL